MVGVTERHVTAQETARFVDLAIFNPVVWNTDSYRQNSSLMLSARGATMAPGNTSSARRHIRRSPATWRRRPAGKSRLTARTQPLGALRHRLQTLSNADDPARLRDRSGRDAPCNGGQGRGRSRACRRDPVLDTVVEAVISRARGYLERVKQAEPAPEGAAAPSP